MDNSLEIVDKKAIGAFTPASEVNTDVPRALDALAKHERQLGHLV